MQSVYSDYPDVTREELKPSPLMTEYITQGPEVHGFGDRRGEESGQEVAGDLHTEEQKLCTFFKAKKKEDQAGQDGECLAVQRDFWALCRDQLFMAGHSLPESCKASA